MEECECSDFEWTFIERVEYDYQFWDKYLCDNCGEEHWKQFR